MSYRPLTDVWHFEDVWFLARSRNKYYGGYPLGFPERARVLLGVTLSDPVLHVCAGKIREYPYRGGFGPNDQTLDMDPAVDPDYLHDVREGIPLNAKDRIALRNDIVPYYTAVEGTPWKALLADPPYSEADAARYNVGASVYPSPNKLISDMIDSVRVGGRVGLLHTVLPRYPKDLAKQIAVVAVYVGNGNVGRTYSVFERIK